jgi:hypothetical protein
MSKTEEQFAAAIKDCRAMFKAKLADYGASWRIMRPTSVTDQLFIKAKRIRTLEAIGEDHSLVGEGIRPEFVAIVNYGIVGLIQLELGAVDKPDIDPERALSLYDAHIKTSTTLMLAKNHDYGEAWRSMRVASYTDLILMKLSRVKEIEDHRGQVAVSEGISANYMDIVNYALFGIIKLSTEEITPTHHA